MQELVQAGDPAKRFKLVQELGEGCVSRPMLPTDGTLAHRRPAVVLRVRSYGKVHLATDVTDGKPVAVKVSVCTRAPRAAPPGEPTHAERQVLHLEDNEIENLVRVRARGARRRLR
jgi:hypothetical protein